MRLYIIRHAEPDYKNDTITDDGHKQAKALAKRLNKEGITRIYCSPLGRAIDTMKYTAKLMDIEPKILEWTREIPRMPINDKDIQDCPAWNLPGEVILKDTSYLTLTDWHKLPIIKGVNAREKFTEIQKESDMFFKKLGYERVGSKYRILEPNREKIAIFCHGGFGRTWLSHLLNIPLPIFWASFFIQTTSVTTILFEERSKEWAVPRCIGFGDTSHLYEAGIECTSTGLKANYY
ncbi:hypothetical protein SH1V18_27050 [Vallitalea longa]|uniref:Histidine phosphatase family protein n=1 Tax=Vallitalea longa TaxID=2936439 RepID=A0A9W6DF57_9FIRM|nr:histidine phosphatase family protein [Vallitalea longa]GKX30225.1 hypothetical protein SH1V18_27050 [Vallitalea longa]